MKNTITSILKFVLFGLILQFSNRFLIADTSLNIPSDTNVQKWQKTLDRISDGVISIRVDGTRAFDTDWNQSTQATGFVVDKERGIILTNRHVVMAGPAVAEGVFLNHEEVELKPIYRDPVHDFGFFQYDPKELKFINPVELQLRPDKVKKSLDIRVIGNDAGEQLSILAGTLAKLDRAAPVYGRGKYNDFNTFYYQAASSTSGGSSGSPVIDIEGDVIALNAGASSQAASSFFLPLDRVVRALKLLRANKEVTRGTIQTVFKHRSYDELRRLGLPESIEAQARAAFPEMKGMLVVDQVLPDSPAFSQIESGDIVTHINGKLFSDFITLENILDQSINKIINLNVHRGQEQFNANILVNDLHALSANEYLEIGNGVVHTLSFQQARNFNVAVQGVYVANPGYMLGNGGIPRSAVIRSINNQAVDNLADMIDIVANLRNKEKVTIRYFTSADVKNLTTRVIYMEHQWFPVQHCKRDDFEDKPIGAWPCTVLNVSVAEGENSETTTSSSTSFVFSNDEVVNKVIPSLVMVTFDAPYLVKGVTQSNYYGTGLIVDSKSGLVLVDRNTVPLTIGDVRLTFAGSLEVPGKVEFIHPIHNIALVSYEPKSIGDTPVKAAKFNYKKLEAGDTVTVVGLQADQTLLSQKTEILSIDDWSSPLSSYFAYRDTNIELISLVNAPQNIDGILVDEKGQVTARWASFSYPGGGQLTQGIPAKILEKAISAYKTEILYSAEIEFSTITLAGARKRGLPQKWAERLEAADPKRRKVLQVERAVSGSDAKNKVYSGDLLLAIDNKAITNFSDVEKAVQKDEVSLIVWRGGEEHEISLKPAKLKGESIDRLVVWAGAYLHEPHRDLLAQRDMDTKGVYVSYYTFGSPATRYGLYAGRRIVEIDGQVINNLDDLVAAVKSKQHRDSVRIKTLAWNNQPNVITLKLDTNFWPFYELIQTDNSWRRREIGVE